MVVFALISVGNDEQLSLLVRLGMILAGIVVIYQGVDLFRRADWYRQQALDEAAELERERVLHVFPSVAWVGVMLAVIFNRASYAKSLVAPGTAVIFCFFGVLLIVLAILVK